MPLFHRLATMTESQVATMTDLDLEAIIRESWPTGMVDHRPRAHVDLAMVVRTDVDTARETKMLDSLERANRKALQKWSEAGREI